MRSIGFQRGLELDEQPKVQAAPLKLFPDQQGAVDAILDAYGQGEKSVIIQEPTGGGKTIIAMFVMRELMSRGLQSSVFMVHRDELVRQTVDKARMTNPGLSIGVVKAEQNTLGAQLTVASQQTIARERRLEQLVAALPENRLLIVDEAHHAVADTWIRTIERIDATFTFGMTATAYRADKKALGDVFGKIVHQTPLLVLIAQKRLKNPVGVRIDTTTDLDAVHTKAGDFQQDELDRAVDTDSRNQLVVDSWMEHREHEGQRFERPIAFCVTKKHAEHLRDTFRASGIPAEMVLGDTPIEERQRIYQDFHDGKIVMTSVGVLTEGWDEPRADAILMTRPTKSLGLWVQMVGRVLRQSMGMEYALVMDFVDNTTKHSLISLATLAGHEAEGDSDTDTGEDEEDEREPGLQEDFLSMCAEVARVRKLRSVTVNLFGTSPYLWGQEAGLWMTSTGKKGTYLALVPEGKTGMFRPAEITPGEKWEKASYRYLWSDPMDGEMARNMAEALVPNNVLTARDAPWRERAASPAQLRYLKTLMSQCGIRGQMIDAVGISSGEASQLIDKYKFRLAAAELGLVGA